jgi:hypothetical protein
MNVYRAHPIKKKQTLDYSCWAACLESWSRTCVKIDNLSEHALLGYYGNGTNGGLSGAKIEPLRTWLKSTRQIKSDLISSGGLEESWVESKLAHSYIMVAYQIDPVKGDWHARLIYGKDNFLYYMEPRTGQLEHQYFYDLTSAQDGMYLFWKD